MSVPMTAQEFWDANTPPRMNQAMVQSTISVDRSTALVARPDGIAEDIPNNKPIHHNIHNLSGYVSGSIPLAETAIQDGDGLLKRKACWSSLVGGRNTSERNVSVIERQYVFITVASMGENSLVHNPDPTRHQDSDIYASLAGTPRIFTSTDIPLKLDFFFYDIEEAEYHLAPKCNDKLLDCFRFIAQRNGTDIFCYCMSQGNGKFERLVQGHFGCGKIWMDIKRYLEQERWSIRYVDFHGAECWIGLLHSRRKESRMFAKYSRPDGFLREHYILGHECLFIHTPAWRRVRDCTESEYKRNDAQFFVDKATQIINGVTVEIGMLKFKMFDADVEDPAGILENKRFLLGKSVRTMKNKRSISHGSRKKMIAAEEKFLEVEKRMADPNIIT